MVSRSVSRSVWAGVRVSRGSPILVQSSLVANADGTMVVRHGVSPYFQQHAMLRHRTVATDIEVIALDYSTVSTYRIFSNILIVGL
jgi:hypothetical protein